MPGFSISFYFSDVIHSQSYLEILEKCPECVIIRVYLNVCKAKKKYNVENCLGKYLEYLFMHKSDCFPESVPVDFCFDVKPNVTIARTGNGETTQTHKH